MNNREAAYKHFMQEEMRIGKSYQDIFNAGYQAALASQKDHIPDVGQMVQTQQTESKPVAWGYAWQCKSVGDWRIEKLGEGCIPPKDTLALYTLPPAPEGE